ncbi:unnamed protein product [Schistosoma mattheei]|uniref:Uncharacterized protein n=1 Tax=Schistosoma mattheei TaxID=31246 RepID=A0AA85AWN8_9TREM|nr:unnamed protein product [Schistosoma mattheei]
MSDIHPEAVGHGAQTAVIPTSNLGQNVKRYQWISAAPTELMDAREFITSWSEHDKERRQLKLSPIKSLRNGHLRLLVRIEYFQLPLPSTGMSGVGIDCERPVGGETKTRHQSMESLTVGLSYADKRRQHGWNPRISKPTVRDFG